MIIDQLIALADRGDAQADHAVSSPGFAIRPVHQVIVVDDAGRCLGISPTKGKERRTRNGVRFEAKEYEIPLFKSPGSTVLATPLVGVVSYVLGPGDWTKRDEEARHRQHHDEFRKTLSRAARQDSRVGRFLRFYEGPKPDLSSLKLKSGQRLAFVFAESPGELACQVDSMRTFWRQEFSAYMATKQKGGSMCLGCGEIRPSAETHAFIEGIPTSGTTKRFKLISFDKDAFCSHGLAKSLNAPTCQDCVDKYTDAINRLLSGPTTRHRDEDAKIVYAFWSRKANVAFDLNAAFVQADEQAVKQLYESLHGPARREALSEGDADRFYVLALSASGARAVIRDWIETHLPAVQRSIALWYRDLTVALDRPWPNGKEPRAAPPKCFGEFPLSLVCRSVGRKVTKGWEVPADLSSRLFKAGLTGASVPTSVLAAALQRTRADHDIPPPRAALIRLVLNRLIRSRNQGETEMPEALDSGRPDAAYVCGRLLGVLERIQRLALGDVNATIVDRYFGAVSASPRTILPGLVIKGEQHLGKLRGDNRGAAVNLQKDMEAAMAKLGSPEVWIGELPPVLDLEARGRFAIGFYHQRAEYRKPRSTPPPAETETIVQDSSNSGE